MKGYSMHKTTPSDTSPRYAKFVLFLLLLMYILNFVDRTILIYIQEFIKDELKLTDTQLGLLSGLLFAVFYTGLGIPAAILADKYGRVKVIAAGLGIWSLFTAISGKANSFTGLAIARLGVGFGEAGGVAPSYALISDYFPPKKRATAIAVFSMGIGIGYAISGIAGYWLATAYSWRVAFYALGLPGILLAVIMYFAIKEPERGRYDAAPVQSDGTSTWWDAVKNPVFLMTSLMAAMASLAGYAMLLWGVSFLIRTYNLVSMEQVNILGQDIPFAFVWIIPAFGLSLMLGTVFGGWLSDKLGKRAKHSYITVPILAFTLCTPLFYFGLKASTWQMSLILLSVGTFMNMLYYAPATAIIQKICPAHVRSLGSAIYLMILNLLGLGLGPTLAGWLSTNVFKEAGNNSLQSALVTVVPFYALAGIIGVFILIYVKRRPESFLPAK